MIFLTTFIVYAVYIILSYFIGKLINSILFKQELFGSIQNAFFNILFGDVIILTIYSIIKARFETINIIFILLLIVILIIRKFYAKPTVSSPSQQEILPGRYNVLIWSLIILLPFVIRAIVFYNYEYHLPNIPHYDHQHYMNIAETINKTGKENFFTAKNILFEQYRAVSPYRYHDIWLTSLLIELKYFSAISIYNIIVSSFTILLSLLGFIALFEMYRKVSALMVVLSTLFLFTGFAYFNIGSIFIDTQNPVEYQKLGISYALFIAAILFYKKDMLLIMALPVGLLLIFSAASLPVILCVCVILLIAFLRRRLSFKQAFLLAAPYVIVLGAFVIFYKTFGFKDLGTSFSLPDIKTILFALKGLTIKTIARFWFLILWLIIAFVVNKNVFVTIKKKQQIFLLSLFIIAFCIGFQAIMVNIGDPNQFATNNTIPLLHILLYLLVVITVLNWEQRKILNKTMAVFIVLFLFASFYLTFQNKKGFYRPDKISKYSKGYLDEVASAIQNVHNKIGVYWVDTSYYVNANKMKEFFIRPGEYLKILGNDFDLVSLSADLIPDSKNPSVIYNKSHSAIMIFQQEHKELSMTDLKLEFIKKYQIEYMILGKDAVLPAAIDSLIVKRITDSKSGDVFCLLRK